MIRLNRRPKADRHSPAHRGRDSDYEGDSGYLWDATRPPWICQYHFFRFSKRLFAQGHTSTHFRPSAPTSLTYILALLAMDMTAVDWATTSLRRIKCRVVVEWPDWSRSETSHGWLGGERRSDRFANNWAHNRRYIPFSGARMTSSFGICFGTTALT